MACDREGDPPRLETAYEGLDRPRVSNPAALFTVDSEHGPYESLGSRLCKLPRIRRRSSVPTLLAIHVLVVLSGCAGTLDPSVRPSDSEQHPLRKNLTDLPAALAYADAVRAEYRTVLANQDRVTAGLGAVLIPLTAVVAARRGNLPPRHASTDQLCRSRRGDQLCDRHSQPLQIRDSESKQLDDAVDNKLPRIARMNMILC